MSKRQTLMLLGVLVMVFQYLGFPSLDKYIALIAGLAIIFIAYRLNPEPVKEKKLNFVEHKNDVVEQVDTNPDISTVTEENPKSDIINVQDEKIS